MYDGSVKHPPWDEWGNCQYGILSDNNTVNRRGHPAAGGCGIREVAASRREQESKAVAFNI